MARRSWSEIKAAAKDGPEFDGAAYEAEVRRLDNRERFGAALRAARESAGMSQSSRRGAAELRESSQTLGRLAQRARFPDW